MSEGKSTDRAGGTRRRVRTPQRHLLPLAPEWLTRQQAAAIAGVTMRTIDRMRTSGELRTYRYGNGRQHRPVMISRDDLIKLLTPAKSDGVKSDG